MEPLVGPDLALTESQNELERRGADVGYVKTDDGLEVDFLARHRGAGDEPLRMPGVDMLPAYEWLLTERGRA